jgi:hypothetical protein
MVGVHAANSTGVGFKQVSSVVQPFLAKVGVPSLFFGKPTDARRFLCIESICSLIDTAKILYAVVINSLINVVNDLRRFFTVVDLPRNAMSHVSDGLVADNNVALVVPFSAEVSSFANPPVTIDFIPNLSRLGAVGVVVGDVVGDNFTSHFKLPLELVRGVGTAIPIPRLYTLSKRLLAHQIYLMGR